jgi:hypothetical protein
VHGHGRLERGGGDRLADVLGRRDVGVAAAEVDESLAGASRAAAIVASSRMKYCSGRRSTAVTPP